MSEKNFSDNPYVKKPTDEEKRFWQDRPDWFRQRNQYMWFERIDLNKMSEDGVNEDALFVIHHLIGYIRIREQVISHRERVAHHAIALMREIIVLGLQSTKEEMFAQIKLLQRYLSRMQVVSALDPDAPEFPKDGSDE